MSNAPPPTSTPPAPPTTGNRMYAIVALLFVFGIGGLLWWKFRGQGEEPVTEAPKPPASVPAYNKTEEDIPPPPDPIPEAGAPVSSGQKVAGTYNGCEARACGEGEVPPGLLNGLRQRGNQARKCYTSQLTNDPTLKVKMSINVKVGSNGSVCAASLTDSSNDSVGKCVLGFVKQGGFPAPKGCVANLNVPYSYVPGQ